MIKTFSKFIAVQASCLAALALMAGCAAQPPQTAAAQNTATTKNSDVNCRSEALTGSLIRTQVCSSKDDDARGVKNMEDQIAVAHGTTSAPR